jgi:hypothetical protein
MASIYDREVSAFPISIATSIALESIFAPRQAPYDPQRPIPIHIDITHYTHIYINVYTLYRNLVSSIDKSTFLITPIDDLARCLEQDIEIIRSLLHIEGMGVCTPVFYACSYHKLSTIDTRIQLRASNTDSQRFYKSQYVKAMSILTAHVDVEMLDSEIPGHKTTALIMTHVPYDLVSYTQFRRLDLLESNTGRLKTRHEWNTKYYPVPGYDMTRLPWLRLLLLILGDRTLIHPSDAKLRRMILDIAVSRQFTTATTSDRLLQCIDLDIKDPYIKQFLKGL